ncbi:MAG: aldo/keto reductase [Salinarimonas sp.]|nr:aldo/keto reductase [Salinarimonas sp.]
MQKRSLGRSELVVSPLCFGGNVFGWTADRDMSFKLLDAFLDSGCNFIDTADGYSRWVEGHKGGESETILGEWFAARGNRDKVVLATKIGCDMGPGRQGLSRDRIITGVEDSLRRLRTDYIDLYQTHFDDEDTPVAETLEAYATLVKAGKVRVIGTSNMSIERLQESLAASQAAGLPRYETLQPEYNLCERQTFESTFAPFCAKEQISVIPYFSLAAGFLTGKYRSQADLEGRARAARAGRYVNERGFRILDALDNVAAETGKTQAQVALAWLMARPTVTAPIASATSLDQLAELVGALSLTLSSEAMVKLDAAST